MQNTPKNPNPPMFNLPAIMVVAVIALVSAHIIRVWLVPQQFATDFILLFAAIPARYGEMAGQLPYPVAAWYTPLTHAFLHGDWTHLAMNTAWMLAFGSPVAKRLGVVRFLLLAIIGAVMGFAFHLISHLGEFTPMIGASGFVAAFMGGAIRLSRDQTQPILPLSKCMQNTNFLAFIFIWLAINLLFGLFPEIIGSQGAQIAWQAHVGGFLSGIMLIRILDPQNS